VPVVGANQIGSRPILQIVNPPAQQRNVRGEPLHALAQHFYPIPPLDNQVGQGVFSLLRSSLNVSQQLGSVRRNQLGGGRWSRRASIRNIVRDGEVGLVPYPGNYGYAAGENSPGDLF
jgi:hypothetical protein